MLLFLQRVPVAMIREDYEIHLKNIRLYNEFKILFTTKWNSEFLQMLSTTENVCFVRNTPTENFELQ